MRSAGLWILGFIGGGMMAAAIGLAHPVKLTGLVPPQLEPLAADPFEALQAASRDACQEPHPARFHDQAPDCAVTRRHLEAGEIIYRWNACRVRSDLPCTPRPPGTLRLMAVGDSMTMGALAAAGDTYPAVLERHLARRAGSSFEVHNRGVAGYGLYQSSLLALEAADHDAQLVILGLAANDLVDDLSPEQLRAWDRAAARFAAAAPDAGPASRLGFRLTVLDEAKRLAVASPLALSLKRLLFRSDWLYVELYRRRGAAWLDDPDGERWGARLAHAERLLAGLAARLDAQGRRLVVLVIPQRVQALLVSTAPRPDLDPHAFGRSIEAIGARHGIPVIDGLDMLTGLSRPGDLYHPLDGHFVPEGYRRLGRHVGAELLRRNLLGSS
ncbi:SGNH/GDSL hydrolase family protein [Marinimicrococcus flavescens]|uniref:GDSL-type esterase/lipase family protein n=1 Tax=Marinimicrococcus flavescens TaxID=3031815 RepID=A0AAP3XSY4_9PROT|nr:GDSL-type esterase/lipase family protein [Marinimicrococcus flavescens]